VGRTRHHLRHVQGPLGRGEGLPAQTARRRADRASALDQPHPRHPHPGRHPPWPWQSQTRHGGDYPAAGLRGGPPPAP